MTGARTECATTGGRGRQTRRRARRISGQASGKTNNLSEAPTASKLSPGLYLVSTPIGNAADISLRALDVLRRADAVVCEDTRVTGKLLAIHGLDIRLAVYNDHNAARVRRRLLTRLAGGAAIALASDAGTPLISDPGYKMVREAVAAGIPVTAVPGASAPLTALTVSGLPPDSFFFAGFLPNRRPARLRRLAALVPIEATLIILESARRLPAALADMAEVLGPRLAAVARELTKVFEEVRRARLDELAAAYDEGGPPKGEVVVVVGPPENDGEARLDARLEAAMRATSLSRAVTRVATDTGLARSRVYARALALKGRP